MKLLCIMHCFSSLSVLLVLCLGLKLPEALTTISSFIRIVPQSVSQVKTSSIPEVQIEIAITGIIKYNNANNYIYIKSLLLSIKLLFCIC